MLAHLHPLTARWFRDRFGAPTEAQRLAWPAIAAGKDTLVAAPTGSGKTLAAFLYCLDRLLRRGLEEGLDDATDVLYVSPLKALGNDVRKNLEEPLVEIGALLDESGERRPEIRVAVRSGDTKADERRRLARRPPHILVTTPESLYILLTSGSGRAALAHVRTVIVDEIHAVARDKRGSHLALSLERLDRIVSQSGGARPVRIGLSATQRPIEEIARFLEGARGPGGCAIVDVGQSRVVDLAVEVPGQELSAVASHEMWAEVYDRIAALVRAHRTTIVFVNTRRLAERVAHALEARLGASGVAAHHGSLSRRTRLEAEERLKRGEIGAIVATASLELGIDVGAVDLVCQIGSPRAVATLMQRVGRSGHRLSALPKGRLFALTRDQLLECAAAVRAARAGVVDRITVRRRPLDILAQQVVAMVACEDWSEDELFDVVRRAFPYAALERAEFDAVLDMLASGIATDRGAGPSYLHRDLVHRRVRARRGARIAAVTCGGAIPDVADYDVVVEPEGTFVGRVDEDFAIESMRGDIFLLGNASWQILRVERGTVRVADAQGRPPTIPFWKAEAPSRTDELSEAVSELRRELDARLSPADGGGARRAAVEWLMSECGVPREGAEQMADYVAATRAALGVVPTRRCIVAERFFDESGGMQLVLHAPFGGRVNRAFGLALRKRFCRTFDFELQAAATDDGIVLSLGPQHSFPLEAIFRFLGSKTVRRLLEQAVLAAPMWKTRWRWSATRALAIVRFRNGKKVAAPLQRFRAEDLLAAVFPRMAACGENHDGGDIEIPRHPLVDETLRDCFEEAMDLEGLERVVAGLERGEIDAVARDTREPSPMSHEILNANPYAFLDDAPLEERRARAVATRRGLPDDVATSLGALDPEAIATVAGEAAADPRDAEELHDVLLSLVAVPEALCAPWSPLAEPLLRERRATWLEGGGRRLLVAAERLPLARAAYPDLLARPEIAAPAGVPVPADAAEAIAAIVRGWLSFVGPVTAAVLSERLSLSEESVERALVEVEASGQILRGRFTKEGARGALEWCDRGLLARIHRLTIGRLRREIEPVATQDFIRFLLRWQHVAPGTQLHGEEGLARVVEQLQGFESAAGAWEDSVLRARIAGYQPTWLDALCMGGEVVWGKLAARRDREPGRATAPGRSAPIAIVLREDLPWLLEPPAASERAALSHPARDILEALRTAGASFASDLVQATGRLRVEVEEGLAELVAEGLVTADGFQALRSILSRGRAAREARRKRLGRGRPSLAPARRRSAEGRWAILASPAPRDETVALERIARQLLLRTGVVLRDLLAREAFAPPWRELLPIYRRLEARGEVRGGRFVAGPAGEHFALPEAVEALRAVRRLEPRGELVRVAATDPLNLAGILTPGPRVPSVLGHELWYRDGVPLPAKQAVS